MAVQRLDKIIASTGRWSRREVKLLVKQGRVLVDGFPARTPEDKVDPECTEITVNGENITWRQYTWVMLNKPAGYLSATEDGHGPTVLDLLPPELQKQGLFPVGRLDKDTEGLLLLTNEGVLAHDLLSPRHHVDKIYYARVDGLLTEEDCAAFEEGITLGDGLECRSAGLRILGEGECLVTLREGKISSGEADAGFPRGSRNLLGTGPNGQFDIGFRPCTGGFSFFNEGRTGGLKESPLKRKKNQMLTKKATSFL